MAQLASADEIAAGASQLQPRVGKLSLVKVLSHSVVNPTSDVVGEA